MHIIYGILWGIVAQVVTYIQLQGQLKFEWLKQNMWFGVLMGIPISFMFMQSVKNFVLAFGGEIWPSRLLGFGIGVIIFTIMSELMFREPFTLKTGVCLFLALLIILTQIFWK
jgi:multidrug transporter EmrE-like cation transporter